MKNLKFTLHSGKNNNIRLYLISIVVFTFIQCEEPNSNTENEPMANAGGDQITYVGSYAILDQSWSTVSPQSVKLVEWVQDQTNPEEVSIYAASLRDPTVVGFVKEGIYNFTLKISCKNGETYTDEVKVTVNPRQSGPIEDINLEIRIRYCIKIKEGELFSWKLQMLDSLTKLDFSLKNKITSLKGIENCTNITYLILHNESVEDISPISNLIKLRYLGLPQNYTINDISSLYNLVNLETLILYGNPISDISALGNLRKLKELWLSDLPINNINSLKSLTELEKLYASGVGVNVNFNNIEPLKYLTKLRYLDLAGRGLTDIKPLETLTNLILLEVSYNNLVEISTVSTMKNLIRLYIRKNQVNDLTGVRNLKSLDFLDATDNEIKDISELQYLPSIHLIGLSGNRIEDILPLVNNQFLGKGVHLYLNNNPLNEKSLNEYFASLSARRVVIYY